MKEQILYKELLKEKARRDLFTYCSLTANEFYTDDKIYLKTLCDKLQAFFVSENDILIVNMPPRHGKSRTGGKVVEWLLGTNNTLKIMTGSYNETLSTTFSKNVRNTIQEIKADDNLIVYSDIFPTTKIKYGDAANNLWSLEGGYNNYLATSPTGTATGFGADIIIVDDLIKTAEEAHNANVLEKHWEWFTNTMLSRLESGGKILVFMTRWSTQDLAGKMFTELPKTGFSIDRLVMKAQNKDGTMLCDSILNAEEFKKKTIAMSVEIANANYQQEPIDVKGRLYNSFNTYTEIPEFRRICSYTDTADTGKDYLSTYIYGETALGDAYILDVIYTQEPMEITEPLLANKLVQNKVNVAWIESNNGGRGFARSVKKHLLNHKNNKCIIVWFSQNKNKNARIYSNSAWVQEHVYFPINWDKKWSQLFNDLMSYQKAGKNKHDDAPDALTGICEKFNVAKKEPAKVKLFNGDYL